MKKTLLTLGLVALSVAAFAQGRVNVLNDAGSQVILTSNGALAMSADQGLLGQPIGNTTPLPSGRTLMVGLYGGTSQNSLFLYSTWLMNGAVPAGSIPATHVILNANAATGAPAIPGIATGTPIGASTPWFQVMIWDSSFASYSAAFNAGAYHGAGAEFQLNPSPSSIAYTGTTPPGANSTWVDGPISIGLVPEPSTFALAGLGAAAMLIFRRRK